MTESKHKQSAPVQGTTLAVDGYRLPRRVFLFCLIAELSFVVLDALINFAKWSSYGPVRRLFNIAREDSLANWFMATQTFVVALVIWLIFFVHRSRRQDDPGITTKKIAAWGFLAVFFTYMAADDGALIHERMGSVFEKMYPPSKSSAADGFFGWLQAVFPSYEWHLVILPLFVAAGLFMLIFLWREFAERKTRVLLLLSAGFMGTAVLLDFFEGLRSAHPWNVYAWIWKALELKKYTVKHFARSLEEFLEMLAISVLLMLFLRHLVQTVGTRLAVELRLPGVQR